MKSLVAWSDDREIRRKQQDATLAAEADQTAELKSELGDIIEKLTMSVSLTEAIAMGHRQHGAMKKWVREQGVLVQSTIETQTERMRARLMTAVSETILPLLMEVIEKKAVSDSCAAIEQVLDKTVREGLIVHVPQRLHDAVCAEIQRRGLDVRVESSKVDEINLQSGDTHVETTMGTFVSKLKALVSP